MGLLINDRTLQDIDTAQQHIDKSRAQAYINSMHRMLARQVAENAPYMDKDNSNRRELVVRTFRDAWDYAIANVPETLDALYLQDIAGRLEPDMAIGTRSYAHFRNAPVSLSTKEGPYLPPADKERILIALDRMNEFVQTAGLHPVEEATFYNFHLARIQPFQNGNKRLAQIVMNAYLHANDLCPLSFNEQQSQVYKAHFFGAIRGFGEIASRDDNHLAHFRTLDRSQRQYYDFLAQAELQEILSVQSHLAGLRYSIVDLSHTPERAVLFTAKKQIGSWFASHGLPHQVRLDTTKKQLEVVGDIPDGTLRDILGRIKPLGKYTIADNGQH